MTEQDQSEKQGGFGQAAQYAELGPAEPEGAEAGAVIDTEVEKREAEPIEVQMSRVFDSEWFAETLRLFPDDDRERVLGCAVEYMVAMGGGDEAALEGYLSQLQPVIVSLDYTSYDAFEHKKCELLVDAVVTKLGLGDSETDESKEQIFGYVKDNFITQGYYFHSFNGVFEESIREHGLDPHMRLWDKKELKDISDVCERVGEVHPLGWAHLSSEGTISVGDDADNIYGYAASSPEWFAQFVADSHNMGGPGYDIKAYARRDYAAARDNMERWIHELSFRDEAAIAAGAYSNLSEAESERLMAFFEKHWLELAGEKSGPKLALLERRAIGKDKTMIQSYAAYEEKARKFGDSEVSLPRAIALIMKEFGWHDIQLTKRVEPQYVHIVDLPDYTTMHAA
ncbi:MAG: hypothetical protein JWN01_1030 [Patescibacteria group bacterium]|nr:hypothetical protein [Patescibacteria group bacterium]